MDFDLWNPTKERDMTTDGVYYPPVVYRVGHPQVDVVGPWGSIECDEGVAGAVRRCLLAGMKTAYSCQWDGARIKKFPAYINPWGDCPNQAIDRLPAFEPHDMAEAIGLRRDEWRQYNGVIWFRPFVTKGGE